MPTLLLLLIPPLLLLAGWVISRLRGRPWGKHTTNVALALLLALYFTTTAGLGVFWVAKQELPVFDLHYTFGYVTTFLVVAHVIYNRKSIALFFRRRAPRPLLEPGEKRFRPVVRFLGALTAIGVLIAVGFWLGYERGAQRVVIERLESTPSDRGDTRAGYVVKVEGQREGVTRHYHRRSSFSRYAPFDSSTGFEWERPPRSVYKPYPGAAFTALARTPPARPLGTLAGALRARRPPRDFDPARGLSLGELAHLLHHTNGITETEWEKRAAPSAGALYPTVTYVVVRDVQGLAPGLYQFAVDRHGLHHVRLGPVAAELARVVERGHLVARAPATVVLTGMFHRSGWKYGSRAYRYVLLDTGHVAGNLTLVAGSLGLASAPLARFDDARLASLLGVDGMQEAPFLVVPLGYSSTAPIPGELVWESRFRTVSTLDPGLLKRLIPLVHAATSFEALGHALGPGRRPDRPAFALRGAEPRVELGAPAPTEADLAATILKRRSTRSFASEPLDPAALSAILRDVADAPFVGETDALHLVVFVNRVRAVAPGAYLYRSGALVPLRRGDVAAKIGAAAVDQVMARDAHAVLAFCLDWKRMQVPDGERGYRNLGLRAGLMGQTAYLSATARGGGACGIGAFYEEEVLGLFGGDPKTTAVLYLLALGRKP